MSLRSAAFAGLLAATAFTAPAVAQDAGLLYSQPLSPGAVREVQGKLHAMAGYAGPIDGKWDAASQTALRNFQQARGLQSTGTMNEATAVMMGLDPASLIAGAAAPPPADAAAAPPAPAATAPAPAFALGGDSIRMIQARLRQLGFYTGDIDGAWGAGSQSGLQNFQAAHNLPADGRLDKATVQAMGIDPATMQPQP
jgi:peptidoglycan hydrolase-like protein with peptidoglycan-binding domain